MMENDSNEIRALGEKMMKGFDAKSESKSDCADESCQVPSFGGMPKQESPEKSMFGSFGGLSSNEDANKLKEMGKRMMGQ
jgi:hypothetical protein